MDVGVVTGAPWAEHFGRPVNPAEIHECYDIGVTGTDLLAVDDIDVDCDTRVVTGVRAMGATGQFRD